LYAKNGKRRTWRAAAWLAGRLDHRRQAHVVFARLVQDDRRESGGRAGLRVRDAFVRELPELLEKL